MCDHIALERSCTSDARMCRCMQMPPAAHAIAVAQQYALHQLGNASWDVVFGEVIPEVRRLLRRIHCKHQYSQSGMSSSFASVRSSQQLCS